MYEKKVAETLTLLGVTSNLSGYKFLKMGITEALDTGSKVYMSQIYYSQQGSKASRIESIMRYAVLKSVTGMPHDLYLKIFKTEDRERISNSKFIHSVAEYIRTEELANVK